MGLWFLFSGVQAKSWDLEQKTQGAISCLHFHNILKLINQEISLSSRLSASIPSLAHQHLFAFNINCFRSGGKNRTERKSEVLGILTFFFLHGLNMFIMSDIYTSTYEHSQVCGWGTVWKKSDNYHIEQGWRGRRSSELRKERVQFIRRQESMHRTRQSNNGWNAMWPVEATCDERWGWSGQRAQDTKDPGWPHGVHIHIVPRRGRSLEVLKQIAFVQKATYSQVRKWAREGLLRQGQAGAGRTRGCCWNARWKHDSSLLPGLPFLFLTCKANSVCLAYLKSWEGKLIKIAT